MIKSTVKYSCGCGFSTESDLLAYDHVDKTKHSLSVNGTIVNDDKNVPLPPEVKGRGRVKPPAPTIGDEVGDKLSKIRSLIS